MKKLKKAAALVLAAVMVFSLFASGGHVVTKAEAAPNSAISETYPEATELLTNLGIMNNAEKAWTDPISVEEANAVIETAFYVPPFNPYNWSYAVTIPAGESVTGEQFLHSILPAGIIYWGNYDEAWTACFHLTHGIAGYDGSAALTREQAAQLLVNCLKAQVNYSANGAPEIRGIMLGVNYVKVGTDEVGRPSYQWVRTADGSAITAVYAATPLAVVPGNITWNDLMSAVGYTAEFESTLGGYTERMFNCTITESGVASGEYLCKWTAHEDGVVSLVTKTIEIYDTYTYLGAVLPMNQVSFTAKGHELVIYNNTSAIYPEATELLTNLGIMNGISAAWSDPITVDEANAVIKTMFFDAPFNPYNWGYGEVIPAGDSVTGEQFLHSALTGSGWGTADAVWTTYFHLTRGIDNYDGSAALTREQAAQLLVNCMKASAGYNPSEIRGNMMGFDYRKISVDEMGRPAYQWIRLADNSALTSIYADTPIAVLEGGATWNEISASVGLTAEMESTLFNMGHWSRRMFNYGIWLEGVAPEVYGCNWPGFNAGTYLSKGWTIEIYDTYHIIGAVLDNNTYESRAYDMVVYSGLIAEIKTVDESKKLAMYAEASGVSYGWWDVSGYLNIQGLSEGVYTMHYSSRLGQVCELKPAETLIGNLTAVDFGAGSITVDQTVLSLSSRVSYGRGLLTNENLGQRFVFYRDTFGNILGAKLATFSLQASMTLSQVVGYNFIVAMDDAFADAKMVFEKNGVVSEPVSGTRVESGVYRYTLTMTAKEVSDQITAKLYYGEEEITSIQTSGDAYLAAVVEAYGAESSFGKLAAAVVDYSKAAQAYFQYGDYASVSLDLSSVEVEDAENYVSSVVSSDAGITYYGKSFLAKDVTILRLWFETDATPEVEVTLGGQPVGGVTAGPNALNPGYYCVDIPVTPGNLNKSFHVSVAGAMEFDMGVYDYIKQALAQHGDDTGLVNLCKALYVYGEAAK